MVLVLLIVEYPGTFPGSDVDAIRYENLLSSAIFSSQSPSDAVK